MLAEVCATSEKFPDYPLSALGWEHRRQNLLKEISQLDANIICLQEVQRNHFKQIFHPELTIQGYVMLFKEKKRERYRPTVDG